MQEKECRQTLAVLTDYRVCFIFFIISFFTQLNLTKLKSAPPNHRPYIKKIIMIMTTSITETEICKRAWHV